MKSRGCLGLERTVLLHVKKVKRKDALEILNFLHIISEDEFRDGYGDLTAYNNPWSWLQQYSEAGGDLLGLSIRPRV